ncbi:hypothetical protein U1Q18_002350 [Sarracenia purpurea var. burkii]
MLGYISGLQTQKFWGWALEFIPIENHFRQFAHLLQESCVFPPFISPYLFIFFFLLDFTIIGHFNMPTPRGQNVSSLQHLAPPSFLCIIFLYEPITAPTGCQDRTESQF